jgi:outer membrane protein TolC
MTRARLLAGFAALLLPVTAAGQPTLTLPDAMARARRQHPSARGAEAAARQSSHRVDEARGQYFPRVDFTQEWQRGNQPVFVFGSLLSQRRFDETRFAIGTLNHPDALSNLRSAFTLDQIVYDGGQTGLAVRNAEVAEAAAAADRRRVEQDLALAAAGAYGRVVQLEAALAATRSAVDAAEADLLRARERRDAGLATEADVLTMDVHVAAARQRHVQATGELRVARAELNVAIGAPLDDTFVVAWPAPPAAVERADVLEAAALSARPEAEQARLAGELRANETRLAHAAWLPQVGFTGLYEWNGADPGAMVPSWTVGGRLTLNLFRGFADKARHAAAAEGERRQRAELEQTLLQIRLEVRSALARLEAAQAALAVGQAAEAQARESQRILRDRYDSGLATIAEVLRAAEAVVQAESQAIAARLAVTLQWLALERAAGRL